MRIIFIITSFLILSTTSFGQKKNKYSLYLNVQPEITYYRNDYAFRWNDKFTKSSYNLGLLTNLKYDISKRLFADIGIGFISRKMTTTVFLNQGLLPPPHQSWTQELVETKSISLRTLEIPINVGYNFITKPKLNLFFITGISANYLLNTFYEVSFKKYEDTYSKNYWQGVSVNLGLGLDYKISKNYKITSRASYSIINNVKADKYLFSQDEYAIPITHKYLKMTLGIGRTL